MCCRAVPPVAGKAEPSGKREAGWHKARAAGSKWPQTAPGGPCARPTLRSVVAPTYMAPPKGSVRSARKDRGRALSPPSAAQESCSPTAAPRWLTAPPALLPALPPPPPPGHQPLPAVPPAAASGSSSPLLPWPLCLLLCLLSSAAPPSHPALPALARKPHTPGVTPALLGPLHAPLAIPRAPRAGALRLSSRNAGALP